MSDPAAMPVVIWALAWTLTITLAPHLVRSWTRTALAVAVVLFAGSTILVTLLLTSPPA